MFTPAYLNTVFHYCYLMLSITGVKFGHSMPVFVFSSVLFLALFSGIAFASFTVYDEVKEPDRIRFSLKNEEASSGPDNIIPHTGIPGTQLCKRFESPYDNSNSVYSIDLYGFNAPEEKPAVILKIYSDENGKPKNILYDTYYDSLGKNSGSPRWVSLSIFQYPSVGRFFWACLSSRTNNYGYLWFDSTDKKTDYWYHSNGDLQPFSRTYTIRAKIVTNILNEPAPVPPQDPTTQPDLNTYIIKNDQASSINEDNIIPPATSGQLCKSLTLQKVGLTIYNVGAVGFSTGGSKSINVNIYNDKNSRPSGDPLKTFNSVAFKTDGSPSVPDFSITPTQTFWTCLSSATSDYGYLKFDDSAYKNTDFKLSTNGQWEPAHPHRAYSIRVFAKESNVPIDNPTLLLDTIKTDLDCIMGLSKTCTVEPAPKPIVPEHLYNKIEAQNYPYKWDDIEKELDLLNYDLVNIDSKSLDENKIREISDKVSTLANAVDKAMTVKLPCDMKRLPVCTQRNEMTSQCTMLAECYNDEIDPRTNMCIKSTCRDDVEGSTKTRANSMGRYLIFTFQDFVFKLDPFMKTLKDAEDVEQASNTLTVLMLLFGGGIPTSVKTVLDKVKEVVEPVKISIDFIYLQKCGHDWNKKGYNKKFLRVNIEQLKNPDEVFNAINSIKSCAA